MRSDRGRIIKGLQVVFCCCLVTSGAAEPDPGHWSFQELEVASVPGVGEDHPVDAFLVARLRPEGLGFSRPAEPEALIRRLCLDLVGLPPTPEAVEQFQADWQADSRGAYARKVEELLASPRYGERWGQYWLDAVRYADTHGFEVNTPRPNAWPYRDYVIRAFNEDLPYDRFILEQLVGDTVGEDAATGFLVTAAALMPGQIGKDEESIKRARQDELNEIVINTSATFLGLTVHCARCHDHKFDAISQKDYHRLQAVFAGVRYGDRPIRRDQEKVEVEMSSLVRQIEEIEKQLGERGVRLPVSPLANEERFPASEARFVRFTVHKTNGIEPCIDELEVWSAGDKPENVALASRGVTASSSGDYQDPGKHRLEFINDGQFGNGRSWIASEVEGGWVMLDLGRPVKINRITWARDREGVYKDRLATGYAIEIAGDSGKWKKVADSSDRLGSLKSDGLSGTKRELVQRYQELVGSRDRLGKQAMIFGGRFVSPPKMRLLDRGDVNQPREEVTPGIPEVFGSLELTSGSSDAERRSALAQWIGSDSNPLTARVLVNRIWHGHFGAGLVKTPSDFGTMGGEPSHPLLLDWLADRFMQEGWSVKKLHRLILSSKAYRQSGFPNSLAREKDADNRLLWRFRPRRLEAEVIRDSILQISGSLDFTMGGPGYSLFERNTNYVRVYEPKVTFGPEEWRRMIYSHRVRMEQDGVFGVFDRPDAGLICARRTQSTTPLQALSLFNSSFVQDQSRLLAKRVRSECGDDLERQIDRVFRLCLGRGPDDRELPKGKALVLEHGLSQLSRVLFNSNEFLFLP